MPRRSTYASPGVEDAVKAFPGCRAAGRAQKGGGLERRAKQGSRPEMRETHTWGMEEGTEIGHGRVGCGEEDRGLTHLLVHVYKADPGHQALG